MKSYKELSKIRQKFAQRNGFQGIFAERESVQDALDYAMQIVETLRPADKAGVMTAIMVLVNTYAVREANTPMLKDFVINSMGIHGDLVEVNIISYLEELENEN